MKNFNLSPEDYDKREETSLVNKYNLLALHGEVKKLAEKYLYDGSVVADLGSGTFTYEQYFNKAKRIYALEKSKEMIEFGLPKVKNMIKKLIIINDDVLKANQIPPNSVDLVLAIGLIDYFEHHEQELFFKKCQLMLKDSGNFVLVAHNKYNFVNIVFRLYCGVLGKKLSNAYCLKDIKEIGKASGLQVKEKKVFGARFWLPAKVNQTLGFGFLNFLADNPLTKRLFPGCLLLVLLQKERQPS